MNTSHKQGTKTKEKLDNSPRAQKGKLSIIKERCPHCGHDKALENMTQKKCSRCKKVLK